MFSTDVWSTIGNHIENVYFKNTTDFTSNFSTTIILNLLIYWGNDEDAVRQKLKITSAMVSIFNFFYLFLH